MGLYSTCSPEMKLINNHTYGTNPPEKWEYIDISCRLYVPIYVVERCRLHVHLNPKLRLTRNNTHETNAGKTNTTHTQSTKRIGSLWKSIAWNKVAYVLMVYRLHSICLRWTCVWMFLYMLCEEIKTITMRHGVKHMLLTNVLPPLPWYGCIWQNEKDKRARERGWEATATTENNSISEIPQTKVI